MPETDPDISMQARLVALEAAPAAEVRAFYAAEVFPLELARVRAEAADRAPVDLLLVTCGTQADSVVLSIEATPARRVVLLHTEQSARYAEEAARRVGLGADRGRLASIGDGKSPTGLYRVVLEEWKRCGRPERVVVDVTGGLKTMSGAATLASGALPRARLVYLDAEQRKVGADQVLVWLRQRRLDLDDPREVFGEIERRPALDLAARAQWEAAAARFEALYERVGDLEDEIWAAVCRGYAQLDRMALADGATSLELAVRRLRQVRLRGEEHPLRTEAERLGRQVEAARACADLLTRAGKDDPLAEAACLRDPALGELLHLLLGQAERRLESSEPDLAALLAYRVAEGVVQRGMALRGVDPARPREGVERLAGGAGVEVWLGKVVRRAKKHDIPDLDRPIGSADAYLLLTHLEPSLEERCRPDKFKGLGESRNRSLFAHGLRILEAQKVRELVELAAAFLDWEDPEARPATGVLRGRVLPTGIA